MFNFFNKTDAHIQKDVMTELSWDPSVTDAQVENVQNRIEEALERAASSESRQIKVKVEDGRVQLAGDVHSYAELIAAGNAAWSAPGVTNVENALRISP